MVGLQSLDGGGPPGCPLIHIPKANRKDISKSAISWQDPTLAPLSWVPPMGKIVPGKSQYQKELIWWQAMESCSSALALQRTSAESAGETHPFVGFSLDLLGTHSFKTSSVSILSESIMKLKKCPFGERKHILIETHRCFSGWWFQTFLIFTPTRGNDPIWLAQIFQCSNGLVKNHQLVLFGFQVFKKNWAQINPLYVRGI